MYYCSHCGSELPADAKRCEECGTPFDLSAVLLDANEELSKNPEVTEKNLQKKAEKVARKDAKKAATMAKKAEKEAKRAKKNLEKVERKAKKAAKKAAKKEQKGKRKWPAVLAAILLLVAVAAAVVTAIKLLPMVKTEKKEKPHNYAAYLKDGELFYSDLTQDGKTEISAQLIVKGEDGRYYSDWGSIGKYTTFADEGKRIFFPDKLDFAAYTDGFYLYWRDIDKPEEDARKIDSEVTAYAVNAKGDCVIYLKGEEGNLYYHDLTERQKIATGVKKFMVADDCGKVGFLTEENAVYLWICENNEKNKIASDVSEIVYVADDFSVFYYLKDEALYKQTQNSDDREKIANGVEEVLAVYKTGEIYYTTKAEKKWQYSDFVEDDMADADAAITEPSEPNYPSKPTRPSSSDYRYWSDYYDAVDRYNANLKTYNDKVEKLRSEYNSKKEAYQQRLRRDELRKEIQTEIIYQRRNVLDLNYYNGTESTVVVGEYFRENMVNPENPVAFVEKFDLEKVEKIKFSELAEAAFWLSRINAVIGTTFEDVLVVQGTKMDIEHEYVDSMVIAEDGSMAGYVVYKKDGDASWTMTGDLYKIVISEGAASEPEVLDTDVQRGLVHITEGNHFVYYKNCNDTEPKGDLYLDEVEIDYDVACGVGMNRTTYINGALVYQTDWNTDSGSGTLKIYKDGARHTIADDVWSYTLTESGNILYLYDYSTKYDNGILYYYDGEEAVKLDEDVVYLLNVSDATVKGNLY